MLAFLLQITRNADFSLRDEIIALTPNPDFSQRCNLNMNCPAIYSGGFLGSFITGFSLIWFFLNLVEAKYFFSLIVPDLKVGAIFF